MGKKIFKIIKQPKNFVEENLELDNEQGSKFLDKSLYFTLQLGGISEKTEGKSWKDFETRSEAKTPIKARWLFLRQASHMQFTKRTVPVRSEYMRENRPAVSNSSSANAGAASCAFRHN